MLPPDDSPLGLKGTIIQAGFYLPVRKLLSRKTVGHLAVSGHFAIIYVA